MKDSLDPDTWFSKQDISRFRWQAPRQECVTENYFSYFSTKTYVVGTQNETDYFEHPKHMFKLMDKKKINFTQIIFA